MNLMKNKNVQKGKKRRSVKQFFNDDLDAAVNSYQKKINNGSKSKRENKKNTKWFIFIGFIFLIFVIAFALYLI
ncbi:hypothetical protein [Fructilactobacillus cliffordii]|uniref:Uncharacterized protein n=1 Tax=Fructilactobacillus cliffordii TaxID=2940299 RepID=A0A9Q8ZQW8_9LACO|nr:hypothetical protein [Fructilactobacillus cliffordii]USS89994.1 hypothetical protein M3M40_07155 [Fructilactobacillus cliffordii]